MRQQGFALGELNKLKEKFAKNYAECSQFTEWVCQNDARKIKTLIHERELIKKSDIPILSKIHWLLEDTRRYGTLPFCWFGQRRVYCNAIITFS